MEPGVTSEETIANQASAYRKKDLKGKVALVLGAGNVSMLPVIDFLHKLFVELQVTIVKLNPVNAHLGPLMQEGFQALVDRGVLGFVYGGHMEGDYLCNHPVVEELHLIGSDKTFNFLMFDRPEKSVVKAPFKRLDPLTVKSKRAVEFSRKLAEFEASFSWLKIPGLVSTALRR